MAKSDENQINPKITERLFPVRNRRGDVTKSRLIQATMELVLENGIHSVTFDSVGEKEGMSAAQVKYHFGDKAYLIEQTMKYAVFVYQECIVQAIKDKKGHLAQITSLVDGTVGFVQKHPRAASLFLLFFHSASVFPKYREMHGEMLAHGSDRMVKILEPFQKAKQLTESECRSLALGIWAMIDGLFIYATTTEGERSIEAMRKDILFSMKRMLPK